jgi:predicted amidophosphoribosyltransferase
VASASTITVACPDCGSSATVSLCLANVDESEHVLAFSCRCGHEIDEFDALRLWVESHQAPDAALESVETA